MFSFLQTIGQDCWRSSELMTVAGENFPSAIVESHPALTTYALLLCLLYFLIFVENSFISIVISWRSLGGRLALEDTLANKNLIYAINNTSLLCIPLLALMLYFLNVSPLNFVFILTALALFALIHIGLYHLVGWLKYRPDLMRTLSICSRMHLIVFTTVSLLLLAVDSIVGGLPGSFSALFLLVVFAILFILRSVRSFRIFAENNCSLLFWFLYLCTLEILPLGLLICALVRI